MDRGDRRRVRRPAGLLDADEPRQEPDRYRGCPKEGQSGHIRPLSLGAAPVLRDDRRPRLGGDATGSELADRGHWLFGLGTARDSTEKEEAMLIDRFGDRYREYMEKTGRFFPRCFVWSAS